MFIDASSIGASHVPTGTSDDHYRSTASGKQRDLARSGGYGRPL
jgi:hypothetical protein